MADLFDKDRTVITRHINNIFKEGELEKNSVSANFALTASDGKTYNVEHYNLDVIISFSSGLLSAISRVIATSVLSAILFVLSSL